MSPVHRPTPECSGSTRPAARPVRARTAAATILAVALVACSSGPPVPGWQLDAHAAMADVLAAQLSGEQRLEAAAFERARAQIARTGQTGLMARAELMRCAARVASLDFAPCSGFDARRADAGPAELAYAQYLAGTRPLPDAALLPEPHRSLATQADAAAESQLTAVPDPLARLVAAGVLLRQGRGSPALAELATDTAAAQGWRRPLLAWLQLRQQQAERAGNTAEAARLARRIALVLEAPPR